MNHMKRQKDTTPDEPPRLQSIQYASGEEQKAIANSSRENESSESKKKQCSVVDVLGGESKVQCYKEQYCVETWNVRSMKKGKLNVVK